MDAVIYSIISSIADPVSPTHCQPRSGPRAALKDGRRPDARGPRPAAAVPASKRPVDPQLNQIYLVIYLTYGDPRDSWIPIQIERLVKSIYVGIHE